MTNFDRLLEAAYIAGYDDAEERRSARFEEWRAALSGLDLTPEPEGAPFQIGDFAYVSTSDPVFEQINGEAVQITAARWMAGGKSWVVRPKFGAYEWLIPASGLRR